MAFNVLSVFFPCAVGITHHPVVPPEVTVGACLGVDPGDASPAVPPSDAGKDPPAIWTSGESQGGEGGILCVYQFTFLSTFGIMRILKTFDYNEYQNESLKYKLNVIYEKKPQFSYYAVITVR